MQGLNYVNSVSNSGYAGYGKAEWYTLSKPSAEKSYSKPTAEPNAKEANSKEPPKKKRTKSEQEEFEEWWNGLQNYTPGWMSDPNNQGGPYEDIYGPPRRKRSKLSRTVKFENVYNVKDSPYKPVEKEELMKELGTLAEQENNTKRKGYIKRLFKDSGYSEIIDDGKNVYVEKKGKGKKKIIVGAHYDKVASGTGAVDNGSGAVAVTNLAQALKDHETKNTYVFVAFGEEEKGLIGSKYFVKNMDKKDINNTTYMLNADCIGVNDVSVYTNATDDNIYKVIKAAAEQEKINVVDGQIPWYASSDYAPFADEGIPTGYFASVDYDKYIHNDEDTIDKINPKVYHDTHRLMLDLVYETEMNTKTQGKKTPDKAPENTQGGAP